MDDEKPLMESNEMVSKKDPDTVKEKHCFPYYDFGVSVAERFDGSFVILLMIINFNVGLWVMVALASQDLFKEYLHQDPGDMALYNSIINLPWCFKIVMGIITDNVKICGLKRKPYLIIFAFV